MPIGNFVVNFDSIRI